MISAKFKLGKPFHPWEITSYTEDGWIKALKKYSREYLLSHSKNHFSRLYPKGTRFDSSNYSPIPGWSGGAQFVATNFQTKDKYQLINKCLFEQNGG